MSNGSDFPQSVLLEARQRAHFRCCYCRQHPGDDVHHITPKEEGGLGTIDNAVLLCALCHRTYGHNSEYRRRIEQARDHWYEVAATMYSAVTINQIETAPSPQPMDWYQLESRFDRIRGEVWVIWSRHDRSGSVTWSVYSRDHEDKHIVTRFLNEARLAGKMIADLKNLPAKFPGLTWDDPADTWLNVASALVPSDRFSGSGRDEHGTHASGSIDEVVDASRIACGRIATEFATASPSVSRAERVAMIERWREMVKTIHTQTRMAKNASRSVTSLLEMNADFLRFAPYLSDRSKAAVYGRTAVVAPEQSEMSGTLHAILDDIAALEGRWGLRG